MSTIAACLRQDPAATATAWRERALLLARVLDRDLVFLYAYPDHRLTVDQARRYEALLARRAAGEPLAYIVGDQGFRDLELSVTPAVLIPRPETELLVELALERIGRAASVLDLGTGSGAIALALARGRGDCSITASDVSPQALEVARGNAARLGLPLRLLCSDWFERIEGRFDAIVSNPPYIADHDPHLGAPELRCEPQRALRGGPDGLAALRVIIAAAAAHLHEEGWLIVEHGYDQGEAVAELMRVRGYRDIETCRDLAGHERATLAAAPMPAAPEGCTR